MADIISTLKRGGKEIALESAKIEGMSKGGETGMGSAPGIFNDLKRGGGEYRQESAKTDRKSVV